jgi:hypothetical protein
MAALASARHRSAFYRPRRGKEAVTSNYDEALQKVLDTREESEYWRSLQLFEEAHRQLQELADLSPNWDSYGAEVPNESAKSTAEKVVALLRSMSVPPTRIVASSEGGIGICFVHEDRYADLECFNTGEIVAVSYRGTREPHAWEVAPEDEAIKAAIEQIRAHFST